MSRPRMRKTSTRIPCWQPAKAFRTFKPARGRDGQKMLDSCAALEQCEASCSVVPATAVTCQQQNLRLGLWTFFSEPSLPELFSTGLLACGAVADSCRGTILIERNRCV